MKFMIFVKSNLSLEKSLEERERIERADFPNVEIEVIVEDYTYANGDPIVRVISRGVKSKRD
jgi:hypothetical protein